MNIKEYPFSLINSNDLSEKVRVTKLIISSQLDDNWNKSLPCIYFLYWTLEELDDSELIKVGDKRISLLKYCDDILWQFVQNNNFSNLHDPHFWQINLRAFFQRFSLEYELDAFTSHLLDLINSHHKIEISKLLQSDSPIFIRIREIMDGIRLSIQEGYRISTANKYYSLICFFKYQEHALKVNELTSHLIEYGF